VSNTFLLVGGYDGANDLDTIYLYEPSTEGWTRLPATLGRGRGKVTAMLVDRDAIRDIFRL
jgi:hypothetical protein